MKILDINSLGYEAGGVETGIKDIKRILIENGNDVRILTSNKSNGKKLFSDYTFNYPNTNIIYKILLKLFNPFSFLKLKEILYEFKPEIVCIHRMDYLSPSILFLLKKYPTLMTIHSPEEFIISTLVWFMPHTFYKDKNQITVSNFNTVGKLHYLFHKHIQSQIYKIGLNNVDQYSTPSNYFRNLIKSEIYPIVTTYNGIVLGKFKNKKSTQFKLLYAGRLDKFKGVDFLILAIPKILKVFPKVKLKIIGEGIYRDDLIKLSNKLNLGNIITFEFWQDRNCLYNSYAESDLFILPSIWPEAFGKTGLEAMSTGTPVIGTKIGGIPEWLINGKNGLLIEPGNSDQIAKAIIKVFKNTELWKQMRLNARKQAENFSIVKNADEYLKLYKNIINNKL